MYSFVKMNRGLLVLLLLFAWNAVCFCLSPDWKLVWADEFEGTEINRTRWNFEYGTGDSIGLKGWGNDELQYYTDQPENAFVLTGRLVIQARQENLNDNKYTSARMITRGTGDWQFGRIEVRAKFPFGEGIWPLIWMLPSYEKYGIWPASGELDIAVMTNATLDNEIYTAVILGPLFSRTHHVKILHRTGRGEPKYSEDFHTFAIEWEEDNISWFIDSKCVSSFGRAGLDTTYYTYPFNERFYLVLSLAVGGRAGEPYNTPFPKRFEFDYVRVYQK